MSRFDVYKYDNQLVLFVVEVQADILDELITTVVVPLMPEQFSADEALPRLKTIIRINNDNYIFMTTDISAVTRNSLGKYITNVEENYRYKIIEALDFLFQGFRGWP